MASLEFLVPLRGDDTDWSLVDQIVAIARGFDGYVVTVYAQNDPVEMLAWSMEGTFATSSASLIEAAQKGNDEAWQREQQHMLESAKTYPKLSIEHLIGHPETLTAKRGALSDVAVFSCESARGKTGVSTLFTALLMDAYAPVMVLRSPPVSRFNKIAIAWDGGLEATRAAKTSLPFLQSANDVFIIQSGDNLSDFDKNLSDPKRLADWLLRHDIRARIEVIEGTSDPAQDILSTCAALDIDLLVCGAYGHSRAREFVFGGATRTLLSTTTSPSLFLSH